MSQQPTNDKSYFNTISKGLAYLNNVSFRQDTGSDPVWKAKLSVLQGPEGKVDYERFILYARGEQAIQVLSDLQQYINDNNKVIISFTASNCKAKGWIPEEGKNAGKLMSYQEGQLIFISSARVNGEEVYKAPPREDRSENA